MSFQRVGLRFTARIFESVNPSIGRWTLINGPFPFPANVRQFTSRPVLGALWRRSRMHHVLKLAGNAIPARGVRTLRRSLLPGGLVYNAGRTGEANVERNVATVANGAASSTIISRPIAQSFRTT